MGWSVNHTTQDTDTPITGGGVSPFDLRQSTPQCTGDGRVGGARISAVAGPRVREQPLGIPVKHAG